MKASYTQYKLIFKQPGGTSRGVLREKETWFLKIQDEQGNKGIGECGLFRGLSYDDRPDFEYTLAWVCKNIHLGQKQLVEQMEEFPSIQIGLETAFLSLKANDQQQLMTTDFTLGKVGIPINGLIWMGQPDFMKQQIDEKLAQGFTCLKLKIGALDFEEEINMIKSIRQHFDKNDLSIRVDANGAFAPKNAIQKLEQLASLDIHSIEQPVAPEYKNSLAELCRQTPLPIALDESLIGITDVTKRKVLLQMIKPQFIILKPSLIGGLSGTDSWIKEAEMLGIDWWITSALESNIGLNAIAQYTSTKDIDKPQGLGTGSLFTNNVDSPLMIKGEKLWFDTANPWKIQL
ncbi:MAG: o-succinylbenzoate synthase [Psychroflexus sp.]|nr:o-succinylbenzoate synthase [Psychroflexus sp.]MDR9448391.1 o-succinylbenzoate synthase [Psychroflexus sp.]